MNLIRKARKCATTGVERYWIVDPVGPEVIVLRLVNGVPAEQARHGPAEATLDPAQLLA